MNKDVKISEILKNYQTLDELRESVLLEEIANFRRPSYILQYDDLEDRFAKKSTLRKFDNWAKFIECSQRRHLLTHCDGQVSEQYLKICQEAGYKFEKPVKVGDKLGLGPEYFASSCELIMEVGLKLGHTLWRILFTAKKELASKEELEDLKAADKHLRDVLYEFLQLERWEFAKTIGKFATEQKDHSSELDRQMAIINYSIALKFGGETDKMKKLLASIDWSASTLDLRLGYEVLLDNYAEAANIMRKIGKKSEMVTESVYYQWPLFKEFRNSTEFQESYEVIYGYPFSVELQRVAEQAEALTQNDAAIQTEQ